MSSDVKVDAYTVGSATNIKFHEGMVERETKEKLLKQKGVVLWFTGLSGSGKSTVACTLEHALAARGHMTVLLDGDNVRHGLNSNLGFTADDREENIRRIGEVSKLFAESGMLTLTSFISPYRVDRYAPCSFFLFDSLPTIPSPIAVSIADRDHSSACLNS